MKWTKRDASTTIDEVVKRNVGGELSDITEETPIVNLDKAVNRIADAISAKEKITIFGDYDVDGVTSSSILWTTINVLSGVAPNIRLPRRFSEGFGFSLKAADEISEGLLITVDNGIAAVEAIKAVKAKGVDVLVIDHHLPGETMPDADIIVDPHCFKANPDDFEDWCGAGLAYRICKELIEKTDNDRLKNGTLSYIIQLAALGTICDVMPLVKDNRAIVISGLEAVNTKPCRGLKAICELTETEVVDETTCGFLIGPTINAAGRMKDDGAMMAFDVITACNRAGAGQLSQTAKELIELNELRKAKVSSATETAKEIISNECLYGNYPLVIASDEISEGIVGIVAGKLAEEYHVPTIVLSKTVDGLYKGSARSYGDVNVKAMMDAASDCIIKYGGHEGAGGLTVSPERLDDMYDKMNEYLGDYEFKTTDELFYDLEIEAADMKSAIQELKKYKPFGEGNAPIVFKIKKFGLSPRAGAFYKLMGKNNEHVKLFGNGFSAIGFNLANKLNDESKEITCVGTLSENSFRGKTEIQVEMADFEYVYGTNETQLTRLLRERLRGMGI